MSFGVIAIEREYAAGGSEIGEKLAAKLGIPCYGREILKSASERLQIPIERLSEVEEQMSGSFLYSLAAFSSAASGGSASSLSLEQSLAFTEADIIRSLAYEPCVIVGRRAGALLKDRGDTLRVLIYADKVERINRAVEFYDVNPQQAEAVLRRQDKRRANYFKVTTNTEWKDPDIYHMLLNSGKLGVDSVAEILYMTVKSS